jgi:UDP-N-acetylmuramoyl-L-alanyl-D-glutamate--2,6-diaminopimelate ligase
MAVWNGRLSDLHALLVRSRIINPTEEHSDPQIGGVATDSRRIQQGDLFICLPGATVDGHDYAATAVNAGAVALVVERELPLAVPQLLVPDVREAQAWIANRVYDAPSRQMHVIGVTGTNGKTTTTFLLEHLLQSVGQSVGLMGTIRLRYGGVSRPAVNTTMDAADLQRTLADMVDAGCQSVVMEVSSHALALGRVKGVRFRTGIFTNLTQDHLDFHQTMERYRDAKGLFFARMDHGLALTPNEVQYAVLNADDPASVFYAEQTAAQVIRYGVHDSTADVRAVDVRMGLGGSSFRLETYKGNCEIQTELFGLFNVYNLLAAVAAALVEGFSLDQIAQAMATVKGVDGRFEPVPCGQPFLVVVDYAHTPDGLENVLRTARALTEGRVLTVFGCGGDRDRTKRPQMARMACQYSEVVIATSDNPRSEDPEKILDDVWVGMSEDPAQGYRARQLERIADRESAIRRAIALAEAGDIVMIAGKGHETYQIIQGVTHPFDDRVVARQALNDRGFGSGEGQQ